MLNDQSFSDTFYRTCARGFEQMAPEAQCVLSQTVSGGQGTGGLFCNRAGHEDLYYTFFGLMLAMISNANIRRKACAAKVESVDFASLDLVHRCVWLRVTHMLKWLAVPRWMRNQWFAKLLHRGDQNDLQKLQSLATLPQDKFPQQDAESPYSRFLVTTLYGDFGQPVSPINIDAYRLPGGLFANLKHHVEYGVNATAAALFLLPQETCRESAAALHALQEPDDSFKAVASAPEGDLMSTATAAFALQRCGLTLRYPIKSFLRKCFRENGFFAATPDDPIGDLEYTVYGLLAMGVFLGRDRNI